MATMSRANLLSPDDVRMAVNQDLTVAQRFDVVMVFYNNRPESDSDIASIKANASQSLINADDVVYTDLSFRNKVLHKLQAAGLETKLFYSHESQDGKSKAQSREKSAKYVFCKIGADFHRLCVEADKRQYKLQLKEESPYFGAYTPYVLDKTPLFVDPKIAGNGAASSMGATSASQAATDNNLIINPHTGQPYHRSSSVEALFKRYKPGDKYSIFRTVDRIRLIDEIIRGREQGSAGLDVGVLTEAKKIHAYYPVHERLPQQDLTAAWASRASFFQPQPINKVRDYFGEKISLYFSWLGFYTTWLALPGIFGLAIQIGHWALGTPDNQGIVPLALFMTVWLSLWLEYWKRHNATLNLAWGTAGCEEVEMIRPDFKGESRVNPINDKPEPYFSPNVRMQRFCVNYSVLLVAAVMVCFIVIGTFFLRVYLARLDTANGALIGDLINFALIKIFNVIFMEVAVDMTNRENHRTETEYEDHLIAKRFIFQFVNNYSALFYTAFLKKTDIVYGLNDTCTNNDCMIDLATMLTTFMLGNIIISNFIEYAQPALLNWWAEKGRKAFGKICGCCQGAPSDHHELNEQTDALTGTLAGHESSIELQLRKVQFEGVRAEYDEKIIQYGFITFFVVAFPLAPLLAIIDNLIEIRLDANKMLRQCRRPFPLEAEDIGTYYFILEFMNVVAVLCNLGVMVFTSSMTLEWKFSSQLMLFIMLEHILLGTKFFIKLFIPDVPASVEVLSKRHKHVVNKYIRGVNDDFVAEPFNEDAPDVVADQDDGHEE